MSGSLLHPLQPEKVIYDIGKPRERRSDAVAIHVVILLYGLLYLHNLLKKIIISKIFHKFYLSASVSHQFLAIFRKAEKLPEEKIAMPSLSL